MLLALVKFTIPFVWYYSNYDYIVSHLCINRNNPNVDCNGTCQLKRLIKKENHDNKPNRLPQSEQEQRVNLFFTEHHFYAGIIPVVLNKRALENDRINILWFSEPPCPPPQIG